jgi:hypothetical protein
VWGEKMALIMRSRSMIYAKCSLKKNEQRISPGTPISRLAFPGREAAGETPAP